MTPEDAACNLINLLPAMSLSCIVGNVGTTTTQAGLCGVMRPTECHSSSYPTLLLLYTTCTASRIEHRTCIHWWFDYIVHTSTFLPILLYCPVPFTSLYCLPLTYLLGCCCPRHWLYVYLWVSTIRAMVTGVQFQ